MDTPEQQSLAIEAPVKVERGNPRFNVFALLSIFVTIAAWVILSINGEVALGVSIAAFVLSCLGLKAATRTLRNTAITSLVASTVLMVVLAAFLIVLNAL